GAVATIPGAYVAENHECRSAVFPAFTDVRTTRFLAHRVEVELSHEVPQPRVVRATTRLDLEPAWLPLRERLGRMAAHDLVKSFGHLRLPGMSGLASAQRPRRDSEVL